jgi:hypothetical protein
MARKRSEGADAQQTNRTFERQQRRLNRRWLANAVSGLVLLIIIIVALQFTPYRNIHRDIFDAAKSLLKSLTSGSSTPKEPDPKYW